MEPVKNQAHIVLVHGACHGAWCWYKLKPKLEAAGHQVTALDLTASGINTTKIQDIYTMTEYSKPLLEFMASIPEGEKVILVGHSLGGISLGVAMDTYPEKITVAVFLTAFMPDSIHKPSYVLEKFNEQTPPEALLDSEFVPYGTPEKPGTSFFFGPKFIESNLYQLSPPEDVELAKVLLRPSSLFLEDLTKREPFSNERFGSVKRVYIVCDEDMTIPVDFQRWLIQTIGVSEVEEIKNVDHMAMLSKPEEVLQSLLKIAKNYYS